jgi:hypothetical protein
VLAQRASKDGGPEIAVIFEAFALAPDDGSTWKRKRCCGLKSKNGTSRSTAPLLAGYGVTATCRASFALYNTKDEVDTLADSMIKAREFFA